LSEISKNPENSKSHPKNAILAQRQKFQKPSKLSLSLRTDKITNKKVIAYENKGEMVVTKGEEILLNLLGKPQGVFLTESENLSSGINSESREGNMVGVGYRVGSRKIGGFGSMTNLRLMKEWNDLELRKRYKEYCEKYLEVKEPRKYREYSGYFKKKLSINTSSIITQNSSSHKHFYAVRLHKYFLCIKIGGCLKIMLMRLKKILNLL
jgi:hypothetical protein